MDCRLDTLPDTRLSSLRHPRALVTASASCCHVIASFSISLLPSTHTRTARSRAALAPLYATVVVERRITSAIRTFATHRYKKGNRSLSYFAASTRHLDQLSPLPHLRQTLAARYTLVVFRSRTTCIDIAQRYKPNTLFLGLLYYSADDLCSLTRSYVTQNNQCVCSSCT